ncbi:putative cell wall protein [Neofusicoccum parvum UCRNP2]|uniref:Putative cell wall protein n=1 Tax=Botryosphaeria parva (strain UCR-NP2) TaxID=1287680 RepID=R1GE42_BOTPV|nr:putative cell wall protein [Neofusicoccum parvum UCRNP2]
MKIAAVLASLASAGAALAVPVDPRFPDSGPFKMIVLAYEQPIHYSYVKASGGYFYIGKETNSTCGDVEPVLDGPNSAGALSTYGNGKQNTQQAFLDISGAAGGIFSYIGPLYSSTTPDHVTDKFTRVAGQDISQLYYEGGDWLACPTQTEGEYLVYADKAYGHEVGKDKCIPFEIRTDKVDDPQVCEYL